MRVAVVVPNRDGARWLPGLLASLDAQQLPAERVIVVDDGSVDGSPDALEGAGVEVLRRPVAGGFAIAVNAGIDAAAAGGAEAIAVVNTDVELAPDWLARAVAALAADGRAGAVATKMVTFGDHARIDDAGDILRRDGVCEQRGRGRADDGSFDAVGEVWGACAGAALYRTAALVEVGGFDTRYGMYLEDVDLALRLRIAGWSCRYEPVVARHAGGGSGAPASRWVARNSLILVARWFPARWLPLVAYRQASWLVYAARERRLRAHLAGLGEGLLAVPRALADRRRPGAHPGRRALEAVVLARPWRGPRAGGHRRSPR